MTSLLTFDSYAKNINIESPRSRDACFRQGIQPKELLTLTYEQIQ